jgi:hypothetical protein
LTEADGAQRPPNEQSANTLAGVNWTRAMVSGSPAGAFGAWINSNTSIDGQHVSAGKWTHADGTALSHGQYTGNQVANVFKKVFSFICAPIADLIQMTQDGAEKIRDKRVGDKDAAAHDEERIKQDGKNLGKDAGELLANAALDFVAPEAGVALKVTEEAVETGVKAGVKAGVKEAGSKAPKSAGKDAAGLPARDVLPASVLPDASGLTGRILSKSTGAAKDLTSVDHVKAKVKEKVKDLKEQFTQPQNNNNNDPSEAMEALDLMIQMRGVLQTAQQQRDSERQDSKRQDSKEHAAKEYAAKQHDQEDPPTPASPSAASHQPDKATA